MLDDKELQDLWEKGKTGFTQVPPGEIARTLTYHVHQQFLGVKVLLWTGLATLGGIALLGGINVVGYWNNGLMRGVEAGLTLMALLFAVYGVHLLRTIHRLELADESLTGRLQRLRDLFGTKIEIWNAMSAAACPSLVFTFTSFMDNEGGVYRINQVGLFAVIVAALALFYYAVNKIGQYQVVTEIKHLVATLDSGSPAEAVSFNAWRRRRIVWGIVIFAVLTLLLLWGVWRSWLAAG